MTTVTSADMLSNYMADATSSSSTTDIWGDFDTFLQILTTQLENQDPTEPVDASEFTNQLVQYAEVEQQISTNDKLDNILTVMNSNGITPLLSYVGKYVEIDTDGQLVVQDGTAMLSYTLDSEAQSVTISVQDSEGDVIAEIDGSTSAGVNRVAWDGSLDDGTTAEDGTYTFVLTAKDSSGDTMTVDDVRVIGQVSSIETDTDGDLSLRVGDLEVSDTDILSVFAGVSTSSSTTTDSSSTTSSETETTETES